MAKKLLVARALTTGLLALGACTGNPGEPPPVDAAVDGLTDGPPRDGCGAFDSSVGAIGPLPCGAAPEDQGTAIEPAPPTGAR